MMNGSGKFGSARNGQYGRDCRLTNVADKVVDPIFA